MADFQAKVRAVLDSGSLGTVRSQIETGLSSSPINLSNFTADASSAIKQIQSQLSSQTFNIKINTNGSNAQNAGRQFGKTFTNGLKTSFNFDNIRSLASHSLRNGLMADGGLSDTAAADIVNKITRAASSANIEVTNLSTQFSKLGDKDQKLKNFKIEGIEKSTGAAVSMIATYNMETEELLSRNTKLSLSFKETADAAKAAKEAAAKTDLVKSIGDKVSTGDVDARAEAIASEFIKLNNVSDSLANNFNNFSTAYNTLITSTDPDELISAWERFNTLMPTIGAQIRNTAREESEAAKAAKDVAATEKALTTINNSVSTGAVSAKFESVLHSYRELGEYTPELTTNMNNLTTAFNTLTSGTASPDDMLSAWKDFNGLIPTVTAQMKNLKTEENDITKAAKETAKAFETLTKSQTQSSKIQQWMNTNSAAAKHFNKELSDMLQKLEGNKDPKVLKDVQQRFNLLNAEAKRLNLTADSFGQKFKSVALQALGLTSAVAVFNTVKRAVKEGVSTVTKLDDSLIDLKKTTTMSSSDLKDFYYDANKEAKVLGVTTQQIIQSAADWSRMGFSDKESATMMARYASQFAAISPGMSVEDATTGLVSVMKAFDLSYNDVLDGVMSKINIVGNSFSTTNAEIVQGLQKSAASFSVIGGSLEENIALFTAG